MRAAVLPAWMELIRRVGLPAGMGLRALIGLIAWLGLTAGSAGAQIVRIASPDSAQSAYFGGAVALSGGTLAVGATGTPSCGPNSGAVYLYERTDVQWMPAGSLTAGDCTEEAYFGRALALDGDILVVTAYHSHLATAQSNAVYVFERDDAGDWQQTARFDGGVSQETGAFAASVALRGEFLLVTRAGDSGQARFHGEAFIYRRDASGAWVQEAILETNRPPARGAFGTSAALGDGIAVIGASTYGREQPGSLFVYRRDSNGVWILEQVLGGIDDYFLPVDISGNRIHVGETREGGEGDGRVTLFERDPRGKWIRNGSLAAPSPYPSGGFGAELRASGHRLIVVGFDEQLQFDFNIDRVVYAFNLTPSGWSQPQLIDIGAVYFGSSIALDGHTAIIGETRPDGTGAVYVVTLR